MSLKKGTKKNEKKNERELGFEKPRKHSVESRVKTTNKINIEIVRVL